MAAARGDRVNMMMANRRRAETETPKYDYKWVQHRAAQALALAHHLSRFSPSRPMYRSSRFVGPATSAPASSTTAPMHDDIVEFSGGLFAPFQPASAALGESVCLPHKHLIANQTVLSLPMGAESSLEELEEQQLHYPRSSCSNSSWQRSQRISLAAHDANADDDDYDDDDDDDDVRGDADAEDVDVDNDEDEDDEYSTQNVAGAGSERRLEEAIAPAASEQGGKMAANDANCLENGHKLIQVSST